MVMLTKEIIDEVRRNFGGAASEKQVRSNAEVRASESRPINLRLLDRASKVILKPRRYQVELYQKALERNVIIYLGTGLGKTFITVLLLKSPQIDDQIRAARKVVFLAPTQDLVKQQAECISRQVDYKVKVYCGRTCNAGLHINYWSASDWRCELGKIDILFMTPAILAAAVATNFVSWSNFSLVIFDEAHHAASSKGERAGKKVGHPYSQLLAHYKNMFATCDGPKPKFVALTASLINNMPKDASSIALSVLDLERKFYAKCVTDLNAIESRPDMIIYNYNEPTINNQNDTIYQLLLEYSDRMAKALSIHEAKKISELGVKTESQKEVLAYHNRLRLAASGFSIKPQSFGKVLKHLANIRLNSGIWTFSYICYSLTEAMCKHSDYSNLSKEIAPIYKEFASLLMKILVAVHGVVNGDDRKVLLDYSQPKLMCLLEVLSREYLRTQSPKELEEHVDKKFSCIVFVRSRVEVLAICNWLKMVSLKIPGYDFIRVNYAVGMSATMASKWACITRRRSTEQSNMLDDFRQNRINVVVTTSVLEEGIDLPVCSTVIRYDSAPTFRVYVQSRGRARMANSTYIDLSESQKAKDAEITLTKFNDFEFRVKETLTSQVEQTRPAPASASGDHVSDDEPDVFKDEERNIYILPSTARVILCMYFSRLSRRVPYSDGLLFERAQFKNNYYQTTLLFPPGCSCKDSVKGAPRPTIRQADSSAVIQAYRALYEAGELDEHGIPIKATEEHIDHMLAGQNLEPNFKPLDRYLEGRVASVGETTYYHFPCELSRVNGNLRTDYSSRTYKLYRCSFKANSDDEVRQDARRFFEEPIFGMVVDANVDEKSWPDKLNSHYGVYRVEYKLVTDDLKIDSSQDHENYLNFTHKLAANFWNLRNLNRETFKLKCLFYLLPLTIDDKIDRAKIVDAFYRMRGSIRQGDIVKLRYGYGSSQRFLVKSIRADMSPRSPVPGRAGQTFADLLYEEYNEQIGDVNQPIIEVYPIAKAHATIKPAKKVKSDYTSKTVFYLSQSLEPIKCDPCTAYQAFNFPEIVYQVYLVNHAAKLSDKFVQETVDDRYDIVLPTASARSPVNEAHDSIDDRSFPSSADSDEEQDPAQLVSQDEATWSDEEENLEGGGSESGEGSDDSYSDGSDTGNDSDSSDDDVRPSTKYLDVLAKQTFKFNERDKSGLEKWDMSEYDVPDLRQMTIQHCSFYQSPRYLDTCPGSETGNLMEQTAGHLNEILHVLEKFHQGIIGNANYEGEDCLLGRPNKTVDLSIEAPLMFDRPGAPTRKLPRQLGFVEALTHRRASARCNLEALENIGDSYIKYCVSVALFKYLGHNEGLLTSARSRLVGNKHFAHLARLNKLGFYSITKEFSPDLLGSILGSGPPVENVLREKSLADMVESLVGACLVYQGEFEAIMALKWLGMGHIFREDTFAELHEKSVVFSRFKSSLIEGLDETARDILRQCKGRVRKFEDIIGYRFSDPSFLVQAFTHASSPVRCTESYERLEFLGDSILDFLVTMTLYKAGFNDPGQLTQSRSALVNNNTFALLALEYKYDIFLQHGNEELYDELARVNEHVKNNKTLDFHETSDFDRVIKLLGDLFESVAGAIYLDSGCSLDAVYRIYYPMMKEGITKEIESPTKNMVSRLHELFPGKDRIKFEFYVTDSGDEGANKTTAKCTIYGLGDFYGEGMNKWAAKLRAASDAMENLPSQEIRQKLNAEYNQVLAAKRQPRGPAGSFRGRGRGRGCGFSSSRGQRNPSRGNFSGPHRGHYSSRPAPSQNRYGH